MPAGVVQPSKLSLFHGITLQALVCNGQDLATFCSRTRCYMLPPWFSICGCTTLAISTGGLGVATVILIMPIQGMGQPAHALDGFFHASKLSDLQWLCRQTCLLDIAPAQPASQHCMYSCAKIGIYRNSRTGCICCRCSITQQPSVCRCTFYKSFRRHASFGNCKERLNRKSSVHPLAKGTRVCIAARYAA